MQQPFHVLDGGGEGQRPNADGVAIEGHHVVPSCGAVLEDEHLALAFGPKVEQFVARAAQEAGEIEVAGLERRLRSAWLSASSFVQLTLDVPLKKRASRTIGKKPLEWNHAVQKPELFEPDAHSDRRDEKLFSKRL